MASPPQIYTNETIGSLTTQYDMFVCGSDQIWNVTWGQCDVYFLGFVPDIFPKIAYAASIGVDVLSQEQINAMRPLVNRLHYISVREVHAIELLKDATDKEVTWVLDPTLLFTEEEWNSIAAANPISSRYICAYILGTDPKNWEYVTAFAKQKGLPVVTFPLVASDNIQQMQFGDQHIYGGPDVFLLCIRDAEYVLTDSFHGAVFSLLYHKKFIVLKRSGDTEKGSMNSRLYRLFQIVGLKDHMTSPENPQIEEIMESVEYTSVDQALTGWRKQSYLWLYQALEGQNNSVGADE